MINPDAVDEMLDELRVIERELRLSRDILKLFFISTSCRIISDSIIELERDRDFVLMCLQDEFIMGMDDSVVARDFGLEISRFNLLVK